MSFEDGLQPVSQSDLKIIKLGVIFSAMLCGCVVTLALSYIPLLFQTSHTIPRPMRNFLLVYVTFMVAVSTVNTVTLIIAFAIGRKIFKMHTGPSAEDNASGLDPDTFPNGLAGALCAIFASWGADGFMILRCGMHMVWFGGLRHPLFSSLVLVLQASVVILVAIIIFIIVPLASGDTSIYSNTMDISLLNFFLIISTTFNGIAAILIVIRMKSFQRNLRTVGLGPSSPYTAFMEIWVESAALIVLFNIVYLVLTISFADVIPESFIVMQCLIHINVILPLLIIYRMALGKAATSSPRRPENGP